MDTGSQLIWMQCQPCQSCVSQNATLFSPSSSSSYTTESCSSTACASLPRQSSQSNACQYSYSYASQASTQGQLGTETLTLLSPEASTSAFPRLVFGCGLNNHGEYGGAAGLVGMGQSSLSLPSQLSSVLGGKKFSNCLLSHATLPSSSSASPSSLVIGEAAAESASRMQFTPIVANPAVVASLYYIDVLGFSVNNVRLNIPASTFSIQADGRGGIILDSGTTYTYLPSAAFSVIQQAFDTFIKLPRYSNHPYLPLCYSVQEGQETTAIPPFTFTVHLQGMDLAVPLDNYFTKVDEQEPIV
ncbi:hypothetical protein KP509_05G004600 [Ceratopteris richardii]|uniref:Peptidase A1 domain-containing protein n=1 Tax=Ceratopteris richardii TaxID=49495 RepID=A0A8T2URY6_CERRI|nr:hypothetical protein KP509_05G004600 [Ceratopteris richardii]